MKEITYEDWQENPTPRMMWVWDNENTKQHRKVVYFLGSKSPSPVVALTKDETITELFKHCAEIEKQRRMTNKELSRWLREKHTREYKCKTGDGYIYSFYEYKEHCGDEEVRSNVVIREDDGEWREPFVEQE